MSDRKQLKELYKQMKPPMGIIKVYCKETNRCFLEKSVNLTGTINSIKFQLGFGSHQNHALQKDWKTYGEGGFVMEIAEILPYDKDESKTDYSEELQILMMLTVEKMSKECELY